MYAPPVAQSTTAPAPTFSLQTLREVLAELEPLHGGRAVRAATIVACRAIVPGASGQAWYVQSETDPGRDYIVCCARGFDHWCCGCKDWERRGVGLGACKHILAVRILRECEARERGPEPPPIPFPFPALPVDEPITYELTPLGLAATERAPRRIGAGDGVCRHQCPGCRTLHEHPAACAYPAMPQLCDRCYEREYGVTKPAARAARAA